MEFLACFLHFPLCLLHKGNTEEENNGYTSSFYEISTYQLGRWVVVRDANATSFCSIGICIDDVNCFSSISDTCFIALGVFDYKPCRFFLSSTLCIRPQKEGTSFWSLGWVGTTKGRTYVVQIEEKKEGVSIAPWKEQKQSTMRFRGGTSAMCFMKGDAKNCWGPQSYELTRGPPLLVQNFRL